MAHVLTIQANQATLDYYEASRIADLLKNRPSSGLVVVDLSSATEATTAAFARLVLLRRTLLRRGADIRIRGLHDRPRNLYEICRLEKILPTADEDQPTSSAPPERSPSPRSGPRGDGSELQSRGLPFGKALR